MNDTKIASKAKAQLASFMGDDETLEASVSEAVLRDGARSVRSDTLLLVDPTEIRKEFSYKMEFVTHVRDVSRSSKEGRDVLVMTYARIRNMASLVLASAYFATVWIGRSIKREVLAEHLAHLGKRLGEVPKTTSQNAPQPLSMRVLRVSALKKWVNPSEFSIFLPCRRRFAAVHLAAIERPAVVEPERYAADPHGRKQQPVVARKLRNHDNRRYRCADG